MLLKRAAWLAALEAPDPRVRLWLAFGPDTGGVEALAAAARRALSAAATTDLGGVPLAEAPGRLLEAAASLSLFGERQLVRIDGAGDEAAEAVRLLLEAPAVANPVLVTAGNLPRGSSLRQLAEAHPLARAVAAYEPDAREWPRLVAEAAMAAGVLLGPGQDAALWAAADGNLQVLAAELAKLATAVAASPERPARVPPPLFSALVAGSPGESLDRLLDALVAGDLPALDRELQAWGSESSIPLLRMAGRRLLLLAALRRAVDAGATPRTAVEARRPPVFPLALRDRLVAALPRWPLARLEAALAALVEAERAIKRSRSPGDLLGRAALLVAAAPRP
ncbi:hypothetical protein [Thermaurantiacus tibetensis]|uniref:hypothetical protein n=1 Tax=Thermaurantiacus tibetensis TaxID=2759035 RepID=UPI0018902284|nr:hypothetical protein [Thermaurantiacus tibetensis]